MAEPLSLNVTLKMVDKMTAPAREAMGANKKLAASLERTRGRLIELDQQQRDLARHSKLEDKFGRVSDRVKETSQRVKQLTADFKANAAPSKTLTNRLESARNTLKKLTDQHDALSPAVDASRRKMEAAGVSVDDLSGSQRKLESSINETSQALERQAGKMGKAIRKQQELFQIKRQYQNATQVASNMTVAGAGGMMTGQQILSPVARAVKNAIASESAFSSVKKVVDFEDNTEADAFVRKLREMSFEMPIVTLRLMEIAEAGGQLGIKKDELTGFTRTVAIMSTAFDMSADLAGKSMAKLSNVYQIPISEMEDLGDAINHLSNNTAAKASDMVEVLGRIGGIGKQFGLLPVQAAALSNTFLALGKTPEVAATGINALLLKMQTATIQSKDFKKGLAGIGISAEELERSVRENGQGALTSFLETLKKLPKETQMTTIGRLFGAEYADDIAALVGGLGEYKKALRLVGDEQNYAFSMVQEFDAKNATTAANLTKLDNQITGLSVEIGSALLPSLNSLLTEIKPIISGVMEWARANPELVKTIMYTVIGIGTLIVAGAALTFALGSVLGPLAMIRYGIGMLGAGSGAVGLFGRLASGAGLARISMRGLSLVIGATPLGWLIRLAMLAYYVFTNWDTIWPMLKSGFTGAFDSMGNRLSGWVEEIREQPLKIIGFFATLPIRLAQLGYDAINGFVKGMFDFDIGAEVSKLANKITSAMPNWTKELLGIQENAPVNPVGNEIAGPPIPPGLSSGGIGGRRPDLVGPMVPGQVGFGGGRATGGPVSAGTMYEVNENGPELLTMNNRTFLMASQFGSVSPLQQMPSGIRDIAMQAVNDGEYLPSADKNESASNVVPIRQSAPSVNTTNHQNISITVNAAPGMDEQQIAQQVIQQFRQLQYQQDTTDRHGNLFDGAGL